MLNPLAWLPHPIMSSSGHGVSHLIQPVANVYVLPRCEIALYEDDGDGQIGTVALVIKQLENVRVSDRFASVLTKFTGVPHPQPFHMEEEHEISADGLWDVARLMERNHSYILTILVRSATWVGDTPCESNNWNRIYYFGARTNSSEMSSRDGGEFTGTQTITAIYRDIESGTGTPGAPVDCDDL